MKRNSMCFFVAALAAAIFASVSMAASATSTSLRDDSSLPYDPHAGFVVAAPPSPECDPGTPDLIVRDDGEAENGYGWNPAAGIGKLAELFQPSSYPATITSVCVSLINNLGVDTDLDFTVVVYADNAGGVPGTVLGSKSFTTNTAAVGGLPAVPSLVAFDISDLNLHIANGRVFISIEWDVAASGPGFFVAVDESLTTPITGGHASSDGDPWAPIQSFGGFDDYRTLFIRAGMPPAGPVAAPIAVPALGLWPLMLLGLLLAGVGLRRLI